MFHRALQVDWLVGPTWGHSNHGGGRELNDIAKIFNLTVILIGVLLYYKKCVYYKE